MNAPDIANINEEKKRRILIWNYEHIEKLGGKKQHEHNNNRNQKKNKTRE